MSVPGHFFVELLTNAPQDGHFFVFLGWTLPHVCFERAPRHALAFAKSMGLPMVHVNLTGNDIRAEGAASLAVALPQCASLQHLNLAGNDIGDEGAASLAVAERFAAGSARRRRRP